MSTLYRDYRPQTFKEVLGQNHIKVTLQNEISANKLAQAFLFCGPRAVGKTTLARVLAKTVNCLNRKEGEYEPCNKCANCLSITAGKNLDVVEIDAASNTGVDNVRDNIINFSRLSPANYKFKVFIIDEVHMLSASAFNALLKIIEEPPTYVIFILCTTEIQKVPLTIISRCERFDFKRISIADIVKKLGLIVTAEKVSVEGDVLEAIARRSGGHLRDAESLLGQVLALGGKKISLEQAELVIPRHNNVSALELLDYLGKKDASKAITLINNLADTGVNLKNFTEETISLLRKIMLAKVNPSLTDNLGLNLGENLEMKISEIAAKLSNEKVVIFIKRFLEINNEQKNSAISQLGLELAIIDLCYESFTNNLSTSSGMNSSRREDEQLVINKTSLKSEEKKNILPKEEENSGPIFNLNHQEVMDKWPEFLVKIKKHNHSLSFVLQNCQPEEIIKNKLGLVFKYKFHQDRVNEEIIKQIVSDTLTEVFGASIGFCCRLDENLEIERILNKTNEEEKIEKENVLNNQSPSVVKNLLNTFGGEVVG